MGPKNEQGKNKETTIMTVVIPKSSRDKLSRLKGIYGCDSLACTVSSVVEDIVIPDLLRIVADREASTQSHTTSSYKQISGDPILIHDQSNDERGDAPDEYVRKIDFAIETLEKFNVETMVELNKLLTEGVIEIEYTDNRTKISPCGEMSDVSEWEE